MTFAHASMASLKSLLQELIDEIFFYSIRPRHNILLFPSLDDCPQSRRASQTHPRHQPRGPSLRTRKQLFDVTCLDRVEMFTYLSLRKTSSQLAKWAHEYFYQHAQFVLLHFMFNGEIATLWESNSLRALVPQIQHLEFEIPYLSCGLDRSRIAALSLARPKIIPPYLANCFKLRLHRRWDGWDVELDAGWEQISPPTAVHVEACKKAFCLSLEARLDMAGPTISTLAAANDQLRRMLWAI